MAEAKKLCPDLIAQHVATWREGDDKWAYRDDAAANIVTDKVSLDPYRLESRKILALIKDALPSSLQKVEKASIDEVFLDLSAQVHEVLLERYPEVLKRPPPYNDPTEQLPMPPVSALDWKADALVDLEDEGQESADPDWDDVALLAASDIVRKVRERVRNDLGYTCSAGVAGNKLLSKLGSAFKKPNRQTVIRGRAVDAFLAGFKITKMRNLGGKLGEQVISTFGSAEVTDLLLVPPDQMTLKLGHETGLWVYNTVRGIDTSPVNSRTQIKSMLSAKSFRPAINSVDQAIKWLRIFTADIYTRLLEEGVLENKRRPRSINLHHRRGGQTHSRQGPIPGGNTVTQEGLFDLANDLLRQIVAEGSNVWPCENLSLSVGGFEDGVKGNMGIGAFLVKGQEAVTINAASASVNTRSATPDPPPLSKPEQGSKKRRIDDGTGIHRFFPKRPSVQDDGLPDQSREPSVPPIGREDADGGSAAATSDSSDVTGAPAGELVCSRCGHALPEDNPEEVQSHADWHMAKDLEEEERGAAALAERRTSQVAVLPRSSAPSRGRGASSSRRGRGGRKLEHGQSKLNFG